MAARILLRDAVRLGFRSADPFRCLGSIAVEPRPYQIVQLLMRSGPFVRRRGDRAGFTDAGSPSRNASPPNSTTRPEPSRGSRNPRGKIF